MILMIDWWWLIHASTSQFSQFLHASTSCWSQNDPWQAGMELRLQSQRLNLNFRKKAEKKQANWKHPNPTGKSDLLSRKNIAIWLNLFIQPRISTFWPLHPVKIIIQRKHLFFLQKGRSWGCKFSLSFFTIKKIFPKNHHHFCHSPNSSRKLLLGSPNISPPGRCQTCLVFWINLSCA